MPFQQDVGQQTATLRYPDHRGLLGGGVFRPASPAPSAVRERVPEFPGRHGGRGRQQSRHLRRILEGQLNATSLVQGLVHNVEL